MGQLTAGLYCGLCDVLSGKGADAYLGKPYTERELRAIIASMLRSVRVHKEAAQREAREQALAERATLLESITDAFFALDRDLRFTYANRRALEPRAVAH
jgi:PAS domain-containing protein